MALKTKLANPRVDDSVAIRHPAETSTASVGGIVALLVALGVLDPSDEATVAAIVAAIALVPALVTKVVNRLKTIYAGFRN